ncbi:GNAT family N-acetyltransferase [Isoptericola aurantiacus]|uniref:GNAT family N-acetyltransferase n=1 Tax=Isoptericola aurantiacus TaxID=3377839 RepID=UPI00383AC675
MSDAPLPVTVRDDTGRHVFLALVDDGDGGTVEAGGAYYRAEDGTVTFTHTEVSPEFEGRGVGSALVAGALQQVRADGDRVVAQCPFVEAYLARHPEYQDLIA